jgi:hypothetical protein
LDEMEHARRPYDELGVGVQVCDTDRNGCQITTGVRISHQDRRSARRMAVRSPAFSICIQCGRSTLSATEARAWSNMRPFSSMTFCDAAAVSGWTLPEWTINVLPAAAACSLYHSQSSPNVSFCQ